MAQFAGMAQITKAEKKGGMGATPEGQGDGMASATSLWGPDDDVGNKMQAKLGESSKLDNTAKLREIAR